MAGYGLNLSHFRDVLPRAASAGYVEEHVANYVLHGLEFGFSADIDESALAGRRVFKNYKSAFENKEKVSNALASRVTAGKTLNWGRGMENPRAYQRMAVVLAVRTISRVKPNTPMEAQGTYLAHML